MSKSILMDMDGVIVRGNELVPGADQFIARLHERGIKFLILTNNPTYTQADLHHRLQQLGINVTPDHLYTSALATAAFLHSQHPNGTAFVIGESGLTEALHQVGYVLTDVRPDYVVLGETTSYSYARMTQAVRLIFDGARFMGAGPIQRS
jgi:NagD protein